MVGKPVDPESRFWAFVEPVPWSGCWIWMGALNNGGYGVFGISHGLNKIAHRYAYELLRGPIPNGLHIDHLCRVRSCVNPAHLEAVTQLENNRRQAHPFADKTHCPKGHPYDEKNTRIYEGRRFCKTCYVEYRPQRVASTQRWRAKRKLTRVQIRADEARPTHDADVIQYRSGGTDLPEPTGGQELSRPVALHQQQLTLFR
jgi:hypothetical protein